MQSIKALLNAIFIKGARQVANLGANLGACLHCMKASKEALWTCWI